MTSKVSIQLGDRSLEAEGSEDFVTKLVDRFATLLEGQKSTPPIPAGILDDPTADTIDNEKPDRKMRKARSSTGSGQGCASKLSSLASEGFFLSGKTTSQVADKLRENATPYPKNKISAAVIGMARGKKLRRYQEAGEWLYINV